MSNKHTEKYKSKADLVEELNQNRAELEATKNANSILLKYLVDYISNEVKVKNDK